MERSRRTGVRLPASPRGGPPCSLTSGQLPGGPQCFPGGRPPGPPMCGAARLTKAGRCAPREKRARSLLQAPTAQRLGGLAPTPAHRGPRTMIMSIPHRISCGIDMKAKIRAITPRPPRERRSSPRPSKRTPLTRTAHHKVKRHWIIRGEYRRKTTRDHCGAQREGCRRLAYPSIQSNVHGQNERF